MNTLKISELEPHALWSNFYSLTRIPRPSGKKDEISKFLLDFGKSLNLETLQDKVGNVLIRKPATAGMEDRQTVVLQAHMDMVPQKNNDVDHDFLRDPIDAYIDGEWVTARGTTLGADNGIGIAAAMAVLQAKDIVHPAIEMFITVDEETGMDGAFGLQKNWLKGDILLNLDSEDEGEIFIGCAGGIDANISWEFKSVPVDTNTVALKIEVSGLENGQKVGIQGGHSGLDINLGRANANKLLFRILKEAVKNHKARLASVEGGNMRNAIPREAFAVITIPKGKRQDIENLVKKFEDMFNEEYNLTDNQIVILMSEVELPKNIIPEQIQDDFINAITVCPNGVFRMIPSIPNKVETSMNLAIIEANADKIEVKCLLRSSVESKKKELASKVESLFNLAGAKVEFDGSYSGWNPNPDSAILKTMKQTYLNKFGKEAKVEVVHAGLECGIIGAVEPHLDMISFGPTIRYPHSPSEKVNIKSVGLFWEFLVAVLENTPKK
ncbi:MAG: aminoacyl-histidine dipeptidase [Paludibacter sp.]|nr:aminoacyl-histidine dipeptidase [Paludibacter sp.]